MQDTDAFERDWRHRGLGRPLHREMTFTQAGLVLGRGTLLAEFEKEGLAARGLAYCYQSRMIWIGKTIDGFVQWGNDMRREFVLAQQTFSSLLARKR